MRHIESVPFKLNPGIEIEDYKGKQGAELKATDCVIRLLTINELDILARSKDELEFERSYQKASIVRLGPLTDSEEISDAFGFLLGVDVERISSQIKKLRAQYRDPEPTDAPALNQCPKCGVKLETVVRVAE